MATWVAGSASPLLGNALTQALAMRVLEHLKSWGKRQLILATALLMVLTSVGHAQNSANKPPDGAETARLVWSTLIAVDHANRTGNYSVLRDIGAPRFRDANTAARLAGIFAGFRDRNIGLHRVVLTNPIYSQPPKIQENGMYHIAGSFAFRPEAIKFDLVFEHSANGWLLFGISIFRAPLSEPPAEGGGTETGSDSGG